MSQFRCCLQVDINDTVDEDGNEHIENVQTWKEIKASDAESAAEEYAEFVFSNRDGWEYGVYWDDELAVVVIDEDEKLHTFNIEVQHCPYFCAEEVKI